MSAVSTNLHWEMTDIERNQVITGRKYADALNELATFKWTKRGKMTKLSCLYRNKSNELFQKMAETTDETFDYIENGRIQLADYNGNGFFDMSVAGVYFCVTLVGGVEPVNSPYGKYRVTVPVENFFNAMQGSFYFLNYYLVGSNGYENLYFILVYVDDLEAQSPETQERLSSLVQLNIAESDIICYDNERGIWFYRQGIWLEILVVGDVKIYDLPKDNCKAITGNVTGKNIITNK